MNNKGTPQGLRYFWKILDIHNKGYLTVFSLNYFFRVRWLKGNGQEVSLHPFWLACAQAVGQKMVALGHDPINTEDVIAVGVSSLPSITPGNFHTTFVSSRTKSSTWSVPSSLIRSPLMTCSTPSVQVRRSPANKQRLYLVEITCPHNTLPTPRYGHLHSHRRQRILEVRQPRGAPQRRIPK